MPSRAPAIAALHVAAKLLGGGAATSAGRFLPLSKMRVRVSQGISTDTPTRPRVVAANRPASARPMPLAAPVTTATRS